MIYFGWRCRTSTKPPIQFGWLSSYFRISFLYGDSPSTIRWMIVNHVAGDDMRSLRTWIQPIINCTLTTFWSQKIYINKHYDFGALINILVKSTAQTIDTLSLIFFLDFALHLMIMSSSIIDLLFPPNMKTKKFGSRFSISCCLFRVYWFQAFCFAHCQWFHLLQFGL